MTNIFRTYSNYEHLEQVAKIHFAYNHNPLRSEAQNFTDANLSMSLVINPTLLEMITEAGMERRGTRNHIYTITADVDGRRAVAAFAKKYSTLFAPLTLVGKYTYTNLGEAWPQDVLSRYVERHTREFRAAPRVSTPPSPQSPGYRLNRRDLTGLLPWEGDTVQKAQIQDLITKRNILPLSAAVVQIELRNDTYWVRICENLPRTLHSFIDTEGLVKSSNKARNVSDFSLFEMDHIIEEFRTAYFVEQFFTPESQAALNHVREAQDTVLIGYKAGEPAKAIIRVGAGVTGRRAVKFRAVIDKETGEVTIPRSILTSRRERSRVVPGVGGSHVVTLTLEEAAELQRRESDTKFMTHPSLLDVAAMVASTPAQHDDRLRDYQKEAVGLHLSTNIGYLNSCSPGLGKTVMQLTSMRKRAENIPNYRGLVMAEVNVLKQWEEHFPAWFPEATTVITSSNQNLSEVTAALGNDGPTVIMMPYSNLNNVVREMARRETASEGEPTPNNLGATLLDMHWHDIAADEAVVIRGNSSKQAKAAWALRHNADLGVALTGTPLNTKVRDIINLISWARGDQHLFRGINFEEKYDLTDPASASDLFETFGPLVFRRDNSEIAEELPTVSEPKVMLLTPNAGEQALIDTAEQELRRCYEELLTALDAVAVNEANEAELTQMKEELRTARSAWLGGQTLARMATSDPATIAKSQSIGATLLTGQGLVDGALRETPTKRAALARDAAERIANGEQVLVFVEFEETAHSIKATLEANGIKAETFTGRNRNTRDNHRIDFQAGNLDALIITKAGERGLTLHKAAAVYCYDLPWSIESVIQRIGRAVRIGSTNTNVDVMFLVMKGTVEERIAEKLITTAVSASALLDATRGVDVSNTETMTAFSGLIKTLGSSMSNENIQNFGAQFLNHETEEGETVEDVRAGELVTA